MQTSLYQMAEFFNSQFGYGFSISLPFFILFILVIWQLRVFSFNLPIFTTLLSLFPALTPFVTEISGHTYFTMLNYGLQSDKTLKISAVLLICLFCTSFMIGANLPNKVREYGFRERHYLGFPPLVALMIFVFIIVFLFLESGTIITQGYGSIKLGNQSLFSSVVNQFFNGFVAVFLCYSAGKSRRRFMAFFYILMIAYLLLVSRRSLVISLLIIMTYTFSVNKFTFRQIFGLSLGLFLLLFIGEARTVGIVNYLQGIFEVASSRSFFSLPGGASNIFVGTMGVVHMLGQDALIFPETMPILLWPFGTYEFSIYSSFDYDYNGGMHISNILYWNLGLLGVVLGGVGLGWITMRAHLIALRINKDLGGTLPAMLSFGFILTLPFLVWYHPVGTIKLSIAIVIAFLLLSVIRQTSARNYLSRKI